jgi:hypothetical protein
MTIWTDERKAEARRLWMAGYSASLIAESIGNDCTRNSIIGLAHRGKWGQRRPVYARSTAPKRPRRLYVKPADVKARARPPRPARPPPPPKPIPQRRMPPGGWTLLDLSHHQCHWPVNAPPRGGLYLFCGDRTFNGTAYCEYHHRIGFTGTKRQPSTAGWQPRQAGF